MKQKAFIVCPKDGCLTSEIDLNDLDSLYEKVDCRTIDIVTQYVDGAEYDVVCDDEGLLKDCPLPSAWYGTWYGGRVALTGNLIFCHHDEEGNLTGVSDEEIKSLEERVKQMLLVYNSNGAGTELLGIELDSVI